MQTIAKYEDGQPWSMEVVDVTEK
jgi:hypothetical protein